MESDSLLNLNNKPIPTSSFAFSMKHFLLLILVFFYYSSFAQRLEDSRRTSYYRYIFKITNKEAKLVYKKGLDKVTDKYFHTLIDSFPASKSYAKKLPIGHYLYAYSASDQLVVQLESVNQLQVKLLNNKTDLQVHLHDSLGMAINEAKVEIKGKNIPFQSATYSYRLHKTNKRGLLSVTYKGFTSYHSIDAQYRTTKLKRTLNRVMYSFPLRYTWLPFRDIYYSIRYQYPQGTVKKVINIFNSYERNQRYENKHRGFIAFNKPMYLPKDTVKFKAVLFKKKGRPIQEKVYIRLSGNGKSVVLGTLKPYRKGAYQYTFFLHDSLKLSLNIRYTISLENKKGKPFIEGSFNYEDYELKSNNFQLRADKKEHAIGQSPALFAKGTDENELNLMDARIQLLVLPGRVSDIHASQVFVADTLWKHEQPLEVVGETKIILPDSIFPKASLDYLVEAVFLNANNERHVKKLDLHYHYREVELTLQLQKDSIFAFYKKKGKSLPKKGYLTAYTSEDDTLFSMPVQMPFRGKINPYVAYYEVDSDSLWQSLELADEKALLQCLTNRTKDSLSIQIENPRNIPFWYSIYHQNKKLKSGYERELNFQAKASSYQKYFISLQYVWQGKVAEAEYEIPFSKKQLQIAVQQPMVIYPGQKTTIGIEVKDIAGKPVSDVDITAYGITKKFKELTPPSVPDFSKPYYSRKLYNTFHFKENVDEELHDKLKLNWKEWKGRMGLDSIAYYQFLYPPKGIYSYSLPARDSLTQLAPFVVKNGAIEPVNMLFIDERPLYIRTHTEGERYSFPVDSGFHTLKIRTHHHAIILDSVYVKHGHKLILSADLKVIHPHKRVDSLRTGLSANELRIVNQYLLPVRNTFKDKYSYLKQGNRIFPLWNTSGASSLLAGPISPTYTQFVQKEGFQTDFTFESGYEYEFRPSLLKMRNIPPYKYYLFPYPNQLQPNFKEMAWSEKEIDTLYRRSKEIKIAKQEFFDNPSFTSSGFGKLSLLKIEYPKEKELGIKRILLFKRDDPDFIRVYAGTKLLLHGLAHGNYKILLLLYDNYYLEKDAIEIKSNGTSYIHIKEQSVRAPDTRSQQLDSLVTSMVTKTVYTIQEQEKDLQSIKETYHQTYNVTNNGNYNEEDFYHFVSGVVIDEDGSGLPGVNVLIKGTARGTVTDMNGHFSLYTPPNAVLVVSYIGYVTEDILIGSRAELDIKMFADIQSLSEVVVVGYGIQTRQSLTYSVSSLQGKATGISIRGVSSSVASKPLLIVDGIAFTGEQDDIDPANIVSIEQLKDETAIALYGSKAAGGVIIITTKNKPVTNSTLSIEAGAQTASIRNRFSDYAYWQPHLTTDRQGKTSFEVIFPDDITNWRTFVAAVGSNKRTGIAESEIKAFKTLVGSVALPRFLVEGDSTQAIGKILNYTSDTLSVTTGLEINQKPSFKKQAQVVHSFIDTLLLTATSLDTMQVKYFVQKADGYMDGELRSIPVFAKGTQETKGIFLNLSTDSTLKIGFDKNLGKVKLYAQADVLEVLLEQIEQVKRYEYLCNEQIASKLKALLAEKKIRGFLGEDFRHDVLIEKLIKKLTETQKKEGTWGWWPDAPASTWISTHVAEALIEAMKSGYIARFNKQGLIDYYVYELESLRTADKLRALQLLHGLGAKADFNRYIKALEKDTTLSLAQYLELIEIRQLTNQSYRIDTLFKTRNQTIFGNSYWGKESYALLYSDITMTLTAYRILKRKGGYERELASIRNFFLEKRKNGYYRNTYETTLILETILPDLLKGDKSISPSSITLKGALNNTITTFPSDIEFEPSDSLTIIKKGDLPVYLTAYQQYWNAAPAKVENEFMVKSHFKEINNNILQAGKPVELIVEVEVKKESEYVMIEIPVPAGCSYEEKRNRSLNEVHREYFKNKVSIFCNRLQQGKHTFTISLLPRYSGSYSLNPAKAELMYFPVFFGRNEVRRIKVK